MICVFSILVHGMKGNTVHEISAYRFMYVVTEAEMIFRNCNFSFCSCEESHIFLTLKPYIVAHKIVMSHKNISEKVSYD
jgi:hypothetical protein